MFRHPNHALYPDRCEVRHREWARVDPKYNPPTYIHPSVIENDSSRKKGGWADPVFVSRELFQALVHPRKSVYPLMTDDVGMPMNPTGRTGMEGRGLLGKHGVNHAADPFVTRYNPITGVLEGVFIQRADNGEWALPGGMVDDGENVSQTLYREFLEEAASNVDGEKFKEKLASFFRNKGQLVYTGYVEDPRNTDNAWIETICVRFHLDDPYLIDNLHLNKEGNEEVTGVQWVPLPLEKPLYVNHSFMVGLALHTTYPLLDIPGGVETSSSSSASNLATTNSAS